MNEEKQSLRTLLDQELPDTQWTDADSLRVLRAASAEEKRPAKRKISLAFVLAAAMVLLAVGAIAAAGLIFSPRYDAGKIADQALEEKYDLNQLLRSAYSRHESRDGNTWTFTYDHTWESDAAAAKFGVYTVIVRGGKAVEVSWSHDGDSTDGGLEADVWGPAQIMQYISNYEDTMSCLRAQEPDPTRDPAVSPTPEPVSTFPEDYEGWKAEVLSHAVLTVDEAKEISRQAIITEYHLDDEKAANLQCMMDIYPDTDEDNRNVFVNYYLTDGEPSISIRWDLWPEGEPWQESYGIYWVTLSLLDGEIDEIIYDNANMANG